jgi:predicted nucleotidyltransferase
MDAQPELALVAQALNAEKLEAVLIGNMAAALHGAPVTTIDVDFLFRRTRANLNKLKAVAGRLGARIMRPYYPLSDLFQLQREQDALQVDFMGHIDGIASFESLRSRARRFEIGGHPLLVADLRDIIASKRAAGRPKDKAVLDILKMTLDEEARTEKRPSSRSRKRE